jgi:hypothetical protein
MSPTDLHTALIDVHDAVDVPPLDRVGVQVRARAHRRRRTAGRAAVGVAAALVVGGVAWAVPGGGAPDRATPAPSSEKGRLREPVLAEPVWFVQDDRLTSLDPTGDVQHYAADVDTVVGWTDDRVYAIASGTRRLVVGETTWDAGRGELSFAFGDPPTDKAVGSAALSGDGRFLAWTVADYLTFIDMEADTTTSTQVRAGTVVEGVSAAGVLLASPGAMDLFLDARYRSIPAPDGEPAVAALAQDHVLVRWPDGGSRLYDLASGEVVPVATYPGPTALGPYAERVAVLTGDPVDLRVLEIGPDGGGVRVTGLDGIVLDEVRWADETHLLVRGHDAADLPGLWGCDIDMTCRQLAVDGELSLG